MTLEYNKVTKVLSILRLGNNLGLHGFDSREIKFEKFNPKVFNPKLVELHLDFSDATTEEIFGVLNTDYSGKEEEAVRNTILYNIAKSDDSRGQEKTSYEIFTKELSESWLPSIKNKTGFIYFNSIKGEEVYMDLNVFKIVSNNMFGNLHQVLDDSSFGLFLEDPDGNQEIVNKWDDHNELWVAGLTTSIPNKSKMKEIINFDNIMVAE